MHVNIEIKARCQKPEQVRAILEAQQADFRGVDHQIDTYFHAKEGRLKLREGNIENSLIFYQRNNQSGPKQSDVILYQTSTDKNLKAALRAAIG
ncbi:MAG: adenylate cyclase, partial [Bacteroidota bacterium]